MVVSLSSQIFSLKIRRFNWEQPQLDQLFRMFAAIVTIL